MKFANAITLFAYLYLSPWVPAFSETLKNTKGQKIYSASIQRIDKAGSVEKFTSPITWMWKDSKSFPCASISFKAEENSKKKTSVCLKSHSLIFTPEIKNGILATYHYIIDLPFKRPIVVLADGCENYKLEDSLHGSFFIVGFQCSKNEVYAGATRGIKLDPISINARTPDPLQFLISGKNKKSLGSIILKKIIPDVLPLPPIAVLPTPTPIPPAPPKVEPIVKKGPPRIYQKGKFEIMSGLASVSHENTFPAGVNPTALFKGKQLEIYASAITTKPIKYNLLIAGELRLNSLGGLISIYTLNGYLEKRLGIIKNNSTISLGFGFKAISMGGSDSYGITNVVGSAFRLSLLPKSNRWSLSGAYSPHLKVIPSLKNASYNLMLKYSLPVLKNKFFAGLDLNWIKLETSISSGTVVVNYNEHSYGLLLGYKFGE